MKLRRAAAASAALAVSLASAIAWACPSCALNNKAGLGSWFVLAGMILCPFFVVGSTVYVLKRLAPGLSTETAQTAHPSSSEHHLDLRPTE